MRRITFWFFLLVICPSAIWAVELSFMCDEITGSLDTTISAGVGIRAEQRNLANVGIANGGSYPTLNEDDGNLNYNLWDVYQAALQVTAELDLTYKDWSFFGRTSGLYDPLFEGGNTRRSPHNRAALGTFGHDWRLLDLYLQKDWVHCDQDYSLRAGEQVINWGESTFIPNGLNVINPFDLAKLRQAGSEIRQALLPLPMLRFDATLSDNTSIMAFWNFGWRKVLLDPKGTYFSTNDIVSPNSQWAMLLSAPLIAGVTPNPNDLRPCFDLTCAPGGQLGLAIKRETDKEGNDLDNFGIVFRYYSEELNETEFGLYYTHYASRLPIINAYVGNFAFNPLAPPIPPLTGLEPPWATLIPNSYYFVTYPNNINVVGASFNTMVGTVAIQGEYSLHIGQPLQIDDGQILSAALGSITSIPSQLGIAAPGSFIKGYRRKNYSQAQATVTHNLGTFMCSTQTILLYEIGVTAIHDLESKSVLNYEAPGTQHAHNPLNPIAANPYAGDSWAMGWRGVIRAEYANAIKDWALIPIFAIQHDLFGTLPSPITHFVQDRVQTTLRMDATYLDFRASVAWTAFFGGGKANLLRDRDFITFTAAYSF